MSNFEIYLKVVEAWSARVDAGVFGHSPLSLSQDRRKAMIESDQPRLSIRVDAPAQRLARRPSSPPSAGDQDGFGADRSASKDLRA